MSCDIPEYQDAIETEGLTYLDLRACLHGGGGPQVGDVTRLGG